MWHVKLCICGVLSYPRHSTFESPLEPLPDPALCPEPLHSPTTDCFLSPEPRQEVGPDQVFLQLPQARLYARVNPTHQVQGEEHWGGGFRGGTAGPFYLSF